MGWHCLTVNFSTVRSLVKLNSVLFPGFQFPGSGRISRARPHNPRRGARVLSVSRAMFYHSAAVNVSNAAGRGSDSPPA
ncbi:hypothetical protein EVAR_16787_1 [Eumeta japonica]|uniref:Uncharacterized protein n=1 Tax=Eumeta variegata TaxID=151549 RepID=A0A4C1UMA7_EUMVA|nr:hypothetical protein EVAR_16787_1 [Eumeta japonica]